MGERKLVDEREWLYRRGRVKHILDGAPDSRVFKLREKDNGELSVDVKSMTTVERVAGNPQEFHLYEVANKAVMEIGLTSYHDPLEDGSNDAHAVIVGMTLEDDILPGLLARRCKRVFLP